MKAAWFLAHRIREAMKAGDLAPMGGAGGIVEIDETIIGKVDGAPEKIVGGFGNVAFTPVGRRRSAYSFHVDGATMASLLPIIRANVAAKSAVMADELASDRR